MKYLFILILAFSLKSHAQKLEVLLVGVSHNYSKYPKQDFSDIYRKIDRFKPDAFFGEFLSKEDERNVMDYWCKKDNLVQLNTFRKNRYIDSNLLPQTVQLAGL